MGLVSVTGNGNGRGTSVHPLSWAPLMPGRDDPIRAVESAVREVLSQPRSPALPQRETGTQVFVDRLFSLRQAETLSSGTRVVEFAPGTVVTPMAHDYLKRRGIAIRLGGSSARNGALGEWGFAIDDCQGALESLQRSLLNDPRGWAQLPHSLDNLACWLVDGPGRGVMLVTEEAALNVWKASRREGVRPASAAEPAEVHKAVRTLGMNLLVVEPVGKSISWIKQLGNAFRHAGAPGIPEALKWEASR